MKARRSVRALVAVSAFALVGAVPGTASAAVTVGETFDASPAGGCTNGALAIQTTSPGNQYIVPSAGVLTSWSFYSTDQPSINFKVARATGTPNEFLIVGESGGKATVAGLNTFTDISIDVQAGDVIGLFSSTGGDWCVIDASYGIHQRSGDVAPGAAASFPTTGLIKINISASLEPDCDGDSLGDETEDPELTDPACPQPPPPTPEPEPQPQPGAKADGTLTIDANKGKVEKGRKVTLTGQLDVPSNEACEPGRQIQIQRRLKSEDDSKFATFATPNTDATGNYTLKAKVRKTYFYRAVVAETDACDDETSNSQKVRVQKKTAAQEA